MGAGGPHFPYSASPARQARTRQGSGGLRESGVALWAAFLSAGASKPISQLSPRHSSWTMTASCRLTMATAMRSFPSGYSPAVTPLPERTKKRLQLPNPMDSKAASPFCGLPLACRLPSSWRLNATVGFLACCLPHCSSFLSLGLQWKSLTLRDRRARPPHDPFSIEPSLPTLNDELVRTTATCALPTSSATSTYQAFVIAPFGCRRDSLRLPSPP